MTIELGILGIVFALGVVLVWTKRNETIGAFLIGISVGAIARGLVH